MRILNLAPIYVMWRHGGPAGNSSRHSSSYPSACRAQHQPAPPTMATPPAVPPAVPVTPSDPDSLLKLKLANEHGINLQHQINDLAAKLAKEYEDRYKQDVAKQSQPLIKQQGEQLEIMNKEIPKIKLANKWGDDVQWDPQKEGFFRLVPPQQVQAAKK